jgi:hypothetical protein
VSLSVYRNDGCVFAGPLPLQIMELRGEMPRFNVIAKTVEGRKAALVGPSGWFGWSMWRDALVSPSGAVWRLFAP